VVSCYNSITVAAELDGVKYSSIIYCKKNSPCFNEAIKLQAAPGYFCPNTWEHLEGYMSLSGKCKNKDRVLWEAEFNYKQRATICPIIPVNSYIDLADADEKKSWF